jgi:hypothetical protein
MNEENKKVGAMKSGLKTFCMVFGIGLGLFFFMALAIGLEVISHSDVMRVCGK